MLGQCYSVFTVDFKRVFTHRAITWMRLVVHRDQVNFQEKLSSQGTYLSKYSFTETSSKMYVFKDV